MNICDKCGEPVPYKNDAIVLDAIASNQPIILIAFEARHLLPTANCKGSPSRAQYLDGQPRDTRGYRYLPEYEAMWRAAYAKMQAEN